MPLLLRRGFRKEELFVIEEVSILRQAGIQELFGQIREIRALHWLPVLPLPRCGPFNDLRWLHARVVCRPGDTAARLH